MESTQKINLFWTGGWDSSFRLLQLLVILKKQVQPHYLFDMQRKSLLHELKAMQTIKNKLKAKFPEAAKNLCDTVFLYKDDFDIPKNLLSQFHSIRQKYHIGAQYLWLSSYAVAKRLEDLELSVEKDEFRNTWMEELLPKFKFDGSAYVLDPSVDEHDKIKMFSNFRFPLLDITKEDMQRIARKYDFHEVLDHTWFCHYPILNKPCGACRPCKIALQNQINANFQMPPIIVRKMIQSLRYLKIKSMGWSHALKTS